ncbi:Tripartite tricarboxylate transporter family receptor [Pigmentiphaga humi]|uniref:Tripartite tricarboxylate transporter family receptor n=1 Tax=Pigmentiphaga humi TaxID=2478468 RepID=A0A3P4B3X2_9BURK|nr:tripartite tricarboxylate transporter substrate binding protein [Pigmentiphaga humi]VCU70989.1 Tripartite tricarboxylate transporter family receptor [Pigmentiphaga humi]
MNTLSSSKILVVPLLVALFASFAARSQPAFPPRQINVVVPMAGGTADVLGRLVAPKLAQALSTTVIVDSRPGVGGNIATDHVAKGPQDGSLLLVGVNAPLVVNNTLFKNLPYDPVRDFSPVTMGVSTSQYLVVHPSLPVRSVEDFVAYVKANPGLPYASVGTGGASHLTMEMFRASAGLQMTHVPYRGAGPALTDLVAGNVKAAFLVPGNALPYVPSGRLRLIASSGRQRVAATPDVPTMIESGFKDFEAIAWIGFLVRSGTSPDVVRRYHAELTRILQMPDVKAKLEEMQFEVAPSTPQAFGAFMKEEIARWGAVVKATGVTAD